MTLHLPPPPSNISSIFVLTLNRKHSAHRHGNLPPFVLLFLTSVCVVCLSSSSSQSPHLLVSAHLLHIRPHSIPPFSPSFLPPFLCPDSSFALSLVLSSCLLKAQMGLISLFRDTLLSWSGLCWRSRSRPSRAEPGRTDADGDDGEG